MTAAPLGLRGDRDLVLFSTKRLRFTEVESTLESKYVGTISFQRVSEERVSGRLQSRGRRATMPNIKYRIYCSDQVSISVEAAKVNTGDRRLWFFDAENNLIALFKWSNILGFAVEGSAEGQVLTDKIPVRNEQGRR